MAKARRIYKRAKAVKSIRTVTSTMETVASVRFKKAHKRLMDSGPFAGKIAQVVAAVIGPRSLDHFDHPLLKEKPGNRDVLLMLTSNRGLCGSFNSSVMNVAVNRYSELKDKGYDVLLQVAGKRGQQMMRFRRYAPDKVYEVGETFMGYEKAAAIADALMEQFIAGNISGLEVAYMQFVSAAQQKPVIAQILPLEMLQALPRVAAVVGPRIAHYEFLPSVSAILGRLLPLAVRLKLYQCFLDSAASEQAMRIATMRSATDNADDMIHDLTVQYNRMRQSEITTQLAEIIGGRGEEEA